MTTDIRYAFRLLRKSPGFSLTVVLTLALGIGVNTAIFSVVDAVMLRPLPYPHPESLVAFAEGQRTDPGAGGSVSPANLRDYGDNHVLAGIVHIGTTGLTLTGGSEPERLSAVQTTANFFAVLGVEPALGRGFSAEEDRFGARHVVVLSDELWRRRFGGDPRVIGRAALLDGEPYTILGVMPRRFQAPLEFVTKEPISLYVPSAFDAETLSNRGEHLDHAFARLLPGVSLARASGELNIIASRLARAYPRTNGNQVVHLQPLRARLAEKTRTPLLVLLGAVAMLLLIACANVANLLLARGASQARAVAIRTALGAGRRRIVGELMAQAAVLAAAGCLLGLLVAAWVVRALVALAPQDIPRLHSTTLDATVLAYSIGLTALTTVLCGLFPAWLTSGSAPAQALLASRQGMAGRSPLRWRGALTAAEVALSLMLLIASGLLLKSFVLVSSIDLGFSPDRVVAMDINLPDNRYPDARRRLAFFEQLEQRVAGLPGVRAVAFGRLPLRGHWISSFETAEHPLLDSEAHGPEADFQMVSRGYFDTLQAPLLAGRVFLAGDRNGSEPVVLVNQAFAARYYPGGGPGAAIGHRIRRRGTDAWRTVVGVVAPLHLYGQAQDVEPQVYLPATQTDAYPMAIVGFAVRTAQDPRSLVPAVRREVRAIDGDQPLTRVETLRELVSASLAQRRFQMGLLLAFAGLALLLALIGIFGVISYAVEQRTAEIGLRLAIGARRGDVLGLVLREGLLVTGLGLAVGLAGALAATQLLRSLLFHVQPFDAKTYAVLAAVALGASLAACWLPARRAAAVDPMVALRRE
jgi:putative ABC transport system permease protein